MGIYNLKLARLYNYLCQQAGIDYAIVHSLDGYDEISLTADFKVYGNDGETIFSPESLGFARCGQVDLYGGYTPQEASAIFDAVLENRASPARIDAVVANAAFAIRTIAPSKSIGECIAIARDSIESGKAWNVLKTFIEINS